MTQQEQQDFTESLQAALLWMRAIQERLKANDNTQGPCDALEARLRETEKIHQSEHEGRIKMDLALVAAEKLLQNGDEEVRNHTLAKLKNLKIQWEETTTYIIHCHSRIEWVWLHWSEYLKAYEEFELWLTKQRCSLDAGIELQLGLKEKLWQVDQQRVVVSDIHGQAVLLERLLDEAAALHDRTQDYSVEPQTQKSMQEAYREVRDRAEERLLQLQKIAENHQTFQGCVQAFQSWLLSKNKELTDLMDGENTTESKLNALQSLDFSIAGEEKTLQHIESVGEKVRSSTSPAGVELVLDEAMDLRMHWERLKKGVCDAKEGLCLSLDSYSHYMTSCQQLGEGIGRIRQLLQELDQELDERCKIEDCSEEQLLGRWKTHMGVKNTLTREDCSVELLKTQLKELFKFSADSRHLSDDVLAVVKEHQCVKSRATRLCSESQSGLRNLLQDPLLVYNQWSHVVSQVLEASAEVSDFAHTAMLIQKIEHLLKDSMQLQERLNLLDAKGDLLDSVFGRERSDGLQGELNDAIKNRELLHTQLLQRKSRLQALIVRAKDFDDVYSVIRSKLSHHHDEMMAADGLHPDILAKKSQLRKFKMVQKDLEDLESNLTALNMVVSNNQVNKTQFDRLQADWEHLQKAVMTKVQESEESISSHESFHESLLNIEKWLMITKQKLQSFQSSSGEWSIKDRQHEAERVLGEFPEREIQLQRMEIQGQDIMKSTSDEGRIHILQDMKRLQASWLYLYNTSLNLHRLLNVSKEQTESFSPSRVEALSLENPFLTEKHEVMEDGVRSTAESKSQSGRQEAPPAEESRVLAYPGQGASLEGETEVVTEQSNVSKVTVGCSDNKSTEAEDNILERRQTPSHSKGNTGSLKSRRREFEIWLDKSNELLSTIFITKTATLSAKDLKMRQDNLKALRAEAPWGQEQFQMLLEENQVNDSGSAEDISLEELRYKWMLYKSKLKDVGDIRSRRKAKRAQAKQEDQTIVDKLQKKSGFMRRICHLAFLIWVLLLALLLLLFLLPVLDEGNSCSLSNNYARSFNFMLRYDGPPPT